MTVTLEIPESIAESIGGGNQHVSRQLLEGYAVQGYRTGKLSAFQVRQLLGFESRFETWDFLAAHDAWPGLSDEEVLKDVENALLMHQS